MQYSNSILSVTSVKDFNCRWMKLSCCIAFATLNLLSADADVINGVDFATVYTGDVVPSAAMPTWKATVGGDPVVKANSPSAGILTIDTLASAGSVAYYTIDDTAIWNASTDSTLEISVKIDSTISAPEILSAGQIYFSNGTRDFRIYFTPTSILIGDQKDKDGHATGAYATYDMNTTDAFHTYRFVLSSGSLSLYIDNSQTAAVANYRGTSADSSNLIYFGDSSGGAIGGKMEWRYLAFTNQGALIPVSKIGSPRK